jgi:hypothetical protein
VKAQATERLAFLVLEDIGWQAGVNAYVVADIVYRQIQLVYQGHQ